MCSVQNYVSCCRGTKKRYTVRDARFGATHTICGRLRWSEEQQLPVRIETSRLSILFCSKACNLGRAVRMNAVEVILRAVMTAPGNLPKLAGRNESLTQKTLAEPILQNRTRFLLSRLVSQGEKKDRRQDRAQRRPQTTDTTAGSSAPCWCGGCVRFGVSNCSSPSLRPPGS